MTAVYAGLSLAPILSEDPSPRLSGGIAGSGTLVFNPAGAIGGFAGYDTSDRLAAKFESDWPLDDPCGLSGSFLGRGGAFAGLALDRDFDTVLGLATLIDRPLGDRRCLVFDIGAAAGFTDFDWSVISGARCGDDLRCAALPRDYALTDRIAIGGRNRFLWIEHGPGILRGGGALTRGDAALHLLTLIAGYRF